MNAIRSGEGALRTELVKVLENDENTQSVGAAIQYMARGLKSMLPEDEPIRTEMLQKYIEGEPSIEQVKQACPLHRDYVDHQKKTVTHGWLQQWIEQSSPEQRRKFLVAVTGSGGLQEGRTIRVVFVKGNEILPSSHTCDMQLDLPFEYPNYDTFKSKLELFIDNAQTGFGFL